MPALRPPYVLDAPTFRFPALAAFINRAQLGGERETALACFVGARLIAGIVPGQALPDPTRLERATAARTWLSSVALPPAVRQACARLIDASAGDRTGAAFALAEVMDVTATTLDSASHSELNRLLAQLRG